MTRVGVWFAIAMSSPSCSSAAKPEPELRRDPRLVAPTDDEEGVVAREAVAAKEREKAIDHGHPRIFPWAVWRERNAKWLVNPSDDHCDPRNDHPRRKGESECYPPHNVQLAAIVMHVKFLNRIADNGDMIVDNKIIELTVDRGYGASVNADYYISLLDADDRPATGWVHPKRLEREFSTFVIPYPHALGLQPGKSHVAIVERLTSDDQFPEDDPRSAQ